MYSCVSDVGGSLAYLILVSHLYVPEVKPVGDSQ